MFKPINNAMLKPETDNSNNKKKSFIKTLFSLSLQAIFPAYCVLCRTQTHRHIGGLCTECFDDLLSSITLKHLRLKYLDEVIAFFPYQYPLSSMLHAFKFRGQQSMGTALSALWAQALKQTLNNALSPEISNNLTYVPAHPKHLLLRGFNQSERFAYTISKALRSQNQNTKVIHCCKRIWYSSEQVGLNAKERHNNIKSAYPIDDILFPENIPESITIIDDVTTTGSTLESMARSLKKRGVKRINAWVLMSNRRGIPISNNPHQQESKPIL